MIRIMPWNKWFTLPEKLTSIGKGAFAECSVLTSVNLPQNVSAIGENAFGGCRLIKKVSLPDQLSKLEDYTFDRCESLEKIYIPAQMRTIGDYALATNRAIEVYYGGADSAVWSRISIGSGNSALNRASYHYGQNAGSLILA